MIKGDLKDSYLLCMELTLVPNVDPTFMTTMELVLRKKNAQGGVKENERTVSFLCHRVSAQNCVSSSCLVYQQFESVHTNQMWGRQTFSLRFYEQSDIVKQRQ